jgi:WD40 repeat protein
MRVSRHIYAVVAVGYSADGTALASADASGVVRVWDATSLQERAVFQASGMPWAIALNANGSAVAVSTRAAVDVWQVGAGGDTLAHWPLSPAATSNHVPLTFADAQTLVFAQGATLYRASIGSETPETTEVTGSVYDLRTDDGVVAILQNDRRFEAWRLDDGTRLAQIDDPERWVNRARFSPDWTRAVSIGAQGPRVRLWTLGNGGGSDWLAGYTGPLTGLAYEATTLSAVDDAGYVTLWNPTSGVRVATFETWASGQPGAALAASTDGRWIAAGGDDSVVHLLDAATGAEAAALFGHIRSVTTLAFNADSTLLATGSLDGAIHLWDVANARLLARLHGHSSSVTGLRFSPGGALLASVSHDGTVRLWGVPLE